MGVVIDSKLDKKRGAVATVIVKQGEIKSGVKLYREDKDLGKIKALFDSNGKIVKRAGPGYGAEILGLSEVLPTGSIVFDLVQAAAIRAPKPYVAPVAFDFKAFFEDKEETGLSIILKTETSGEMDAIKSCLPKDIRVATEGQGEVNLADILMAKDLRALVVGFNVGITKEAKVLSQSEGVFYKQYTIIYNLLDELKEALAGLGQEEEVKIRGKAEIIAQFDTEIGKILGVKVIEGRLALNDPVIVARKDIELGRATITLLKRGKQEVKEVGRGLECGVTISPFIDFEVGDVLLSHNASSKS